MASVLSYIHTMGSWPLPGGECLLLHSPDGVLAPTQWRVSSPTFTRWGPGPYPVTSVFSYIHPMGSWPLPSDECLLQHSPDGCPPYPVASAFYIYPMGARLLPGGECLLHLPDGGPAPARWRVPSGRSTSCQLPPGTGRAAGCHLSRWCVRMSPRWHSASH